MASLTAVSGGLELDAPYDASFLAEFKAKIPHHSRKWDGLKKRWLIDASYGNQAADLMEIYFGTRPTVPQVQTVATTVMRLVQLMYIGATKERAGGVWTASGYANGAWSLSFPEAVLKSWFGLEVNADAPVQPDSLYAVLGLKQFSEAPDIKAAYKRLAKVTHPDVCKEPDATERFRALQHAYELLKDDKQRRKYDVGLILEQRAAQAQPQRRAVSFAGDYRAPLTCGLLFVEGIERLSVLDVSKIHRWDDIVDTAGQTMTSYWLAGDDTFTVRWV